MMTIAMAELTPEESRAIARALRRPIGRYNADRASQLSGVPRSTLYSWIRNGHLVPDFAEWDPTQWSYRDLVLARLFAWVRKAGMSASLTAKEVAEVRRKLADRTLDPTLRIRATKFGLYPEGESVDDLTGMQAIPAVLELVQGFDLIAPVDANVDRLWGPSLVHPSAFTAISPDVFAGEPTIRRTRIPTAALYALHEDRGLSSADIAHLYPGLAEEQVDDGLALERRVRGLQAAAA